ncbi:MAG: phage tail protein I [Rhodospirillaceae bacterium]|nr:phage tail protein I [Rhodospirillales bacterium]
MTTNRPSLLPANATWFESTMEQVLAARLTRLEVAADALATLWNPWACPAEYLPWLAWELSVPYWRTEWPEEFKRTLIGDAPAINARRGFVDGIERGLSAIGLKMEITLWHEMEPAGIPGTFRAVLRANDNRLLDRDSVTDAQAMVIATKRQSQHPEFWAAADIDGEMAMAPVATVTVMPKLTGTTDLNGLRMPIKVACAAQAFAGLTTYLMEAS